MSDILLDVKNLKKYFNTPGGVLHAVDDVSFSLERGKTRGGRFSGFMSLPAGKYFLRAGILRKYPIRRCAASGPRCRSFSRTPSRP